MKPIYIKEFVKYKTGLPFKVFLCEIKHVPFHWHKELELLYVIDGELNLKRGDEAYQIQENQLVVINRNEVHQFTETHKSNLTIVVQVNLDHFKAIWPEIVELNFFGHELVDEQGDYHQLKILIKQILETIERQNFGYLIEVQSLICNAITVLAQTFAHNKKNWEEEREEDYARLGRILYYLEQNYMNKITLQMIADTEFLNSYYFSHFFRNKMGVSFQKYLKELRVQKAYEMLLSTDEKMLDIALANGFSNVQTFINAFKDKYDATPSKFKKSLAGKKITIEKSELIARYELVDITKVLERLEEIIES